MVNVMVDETRLLHLLQGCKMLLKVAIIGAPNAGKSTLLNKLIDSNISCVSKKVHTTRRNILGIYTQGSTQLEFYDSPGLVTRDHSLKHKLESTLFTDPERAALRCDLITVLVDAANGRERHGLNKGVIEILARHPDKKSILVLNKVDLIREKRTLLDLSTRLTQGCIEGKLTIDSHELKGLGEKKLKELNLYDQYRKILGHTDEDFSKYQPIERPKHKYVIELDNTKTIDGLPSKGSIKKSADSFGYANFSRVFSISALEDDGIDELREHLMSLAKPVEALPHREGVLSNMTSKEVVHSIIRGKVMDSVPHAIPYLLGYKFLQCHWDDIGNLHIHLVIECPERYMVGAVIGEKGINIYQITTESRDAISKTLGCDVNLVIEAKAKSK